MSEKESSADLVEEMAVEQPVRRKYKNPFVSSASFFLLTDLFERFAYYSATGSLTIYFTRELKLDSVLATQMQATFQSIVYVVPLLGAYAADSYLGRYKTIFYSFIFYCFGMALITGASVPGFNNAPMYFIGLFVGVAVGSGAVKPNLIVMGGDQFDETDAREAKMKLAYFSYFYWCTNIAAFVAFSIMGGLAVQGMGAIGPEVSFFASYAISAIFIVLATLAFLAGTPRYYKALPSGSVLPTFFRVVGSGVGKSLHGMAIAIGSICELVGVVVTIISFFWTNPIVSYVAAGLVALGVVLLVAFGRTTEWVGRGSDADETTIYDAKQVIRMMPYVAFIVVFWAVYNQMNTNFITQGCQMYDTAFGYKWSPSQLALFNTVGVLVGVPVADRLVYPMMAKMGAPPTQLKRVGIGFFFCILAMTVSGFVEVWRKSTPVTTVQSSCSENYQSELNIMWQVPQYVLVGVAEVFTAITYYDLFYSEVPASMRSVCQAINMLTTSLGTMLGGTINSLCRDFLPNDLNEGNLEYVFWLLAGLGAVNLVFFVLVARGFEYSKPMYETEEALVSDEDDLYGKASRRASAISAK